MGNERWAITQNLDDHTVTGNVFRTDGGAPSFIWCQQTSNDGSNLGESCWGADACDIGPCTPSMWTFIANVTLPVSFFAEPSAPQPTAQPTPTDSLSALIGTWHFTFTIISTFTETYRLQHTATTSSGTRGLVGLDEFGSGVAVFRVQDLTPGSSLPFEFSLGDLSTCLIHLFNRNGETVQGETFVLFLDSTGACDPNNFSDPFALPGQRISLSANVLGAEALEVDLSGVQTARYATLTAESDALGTVPTSDQDAVKAVGRALMRAVR